MPRSRPERATGEETVRRLPPPRILGFIGPGMALLALAAYMATMNRTLGVVDCGELAACAWTLGIPHPTGYPTLILLAGLVSHLSPLRPILSLNIFSALLTAASLVPLTLFFDQLLVAGAGARPAAAPLVRRLLAAFAALFTALTGVWWHQGSGFEVYSLQALLLPLLCWLFLRYVDAEGAREVSEKPQAPTKLGFTRCGTIVAFILGLAFTNHLTTAMLAPGFLFLYFRSVITPVGTRSMVRNANSAWRRAFARWLYLAPPFLLGLLPPDAWMMARAATEPRFNWGDPSTLPALMHHLRGRDYGHIMGHWFDAAFATQLAYFRHWIPAAVGYLGLIAGLAGFLVLWRRSRRLGIWSALIFGTTVLTACSYNVNDISNYFMGAVLMLGAWSAVAAAAVCARFGARAAISAQAALVMVCATVNWGLSDARGNTTTEDFARDMLGGLPPNSIVFTKQWDFWESASLYLQAVEGYRADVMVVDVDNLHIDWYVDQLARAYPAVMATVRPEAERVKLGARRVRRGELVRQDQIAAYTRDFNDLTNAIIDRNIDRHPCFMTYDPFDRRIAAGYIRVPWRLATRLTKQNEYLPEEFPAYELRMWRKNIVPQVVWSQKLYAEASQNRAAYEHEHGHDERARRYAELTLSFDPGFRPQDVPDFPAAIEQQLKAELQRFARARDDLRRGIFPPWY